MIIGINGKIGSGKDTVGKIIQYLTSGSADIMSYEEYQTSQSKYRYDSTWEIRKFADKLKDIVCLLIDCTREDLENQEFKNTELGEEWRRWYYTNYKLINNNSKGIISDFFNSKQEALDYFEYIKDPVVKNFVQNSNLQSEILTPRLLLQTIGTDLFRNRLHPDIWVNSLFSNYSDKKQIDRTNVKRKTIYDCNWIITDLRFPNELEVIKEKNGITIRVIRRTTQGISNHKSEIALDNAKFDYEIYNDNTIENLIKQVKNILIKEKII